MKKQLVTNATAQVLLMFAALGSDTRRLNPMSAITNSLLATMDSLSKATSWREWGLPARRWVWP
jgi:hypothetical protein